MTSSGEASPASITPSTTPLGTHAPKYGTVVPNRIFVGGIAANTTEQELKTFFATYGAVKDTKIIFDRAGVSKGYGFVTFETQEDAEKIIKKEADNLIFKDRKLNIGPAIRKQPFPRMYESSISPTIMFTNGQGIPYTYQNGMAFFNQDQIPAQPQQPAYPMVQPVYVAPQPYTAYQTAATAPAQWTASQWRWAPQSAAAPQYVTYPVQALAQEMYGAQPPPQAYQPADIAEASMMEAAPAEVRPKTVI